MFAARSPRGRLLRRAHRQRRPRVADRSPARPAPLPDGGRPGARLRGEQLPVRVQRRQAATPPPRGRPLPGRGQGPPGPPGCPAGPPRRSPAPGFRTACSAWSKERPRGRGLRHPGIAAAAFTGSNAAAWRSPGSPRSVRSRSRSTGRWGASTRPWWRRVPRRREPTRSSAVTRPRSPWAPTSSARTPASCSPARATARHQRAPPRDRRCPDAERAHPDRLSGGRERPGRTPGNAPPGLAGRNVHRPPPPHHGPRGVQGRPRGGGRGVLRPARAGRHLRRPRGRRRRSREPARPADGLLHAEEDETGDLACLATLLADRSGRVLWNQWPTGVSVTNAMQHGGPYPATTAPATTSVGTAAIDRFLRPVAFQGWPQQLLPPPLRDDNPGRSRSGHADQPMEGECGQKVRTLNDASATADTSSPTGGSRSSWTRSATSTRGLDLSAGGASRSPTSSRPTSTTTT